MNFYKAKRLIVNDMIANIEYLRMKVASLSKWEDRYFQYLHRELCNYAFEFFKKRELFDIGWFFMCIQDYYDTIHNDRCYRGSLTLRNGKVFSCYVWIPYYLKMSKWKFRRNQKSLYMVKRG